MVRKLFILLSLALFLGIIQFQKNLFIEPNPEKIPQDSSDLKYNLPFRVSLWEAIKADQLLILNSQNTVTMELNKLKVKRPYYFRVNLKGIEIEALDYQHTKIDPLNYCLTKELKEELNDILKQAQICESPEIEKPQNAIACSTSYTLPYAILVFEGGHKIKLGEKNTGCDFPSGLCGPNNEKLIQWVQRVLMSIKSLRCKGKTP